jgi:hypothetical protein
VNFILLLPLSHSQDKERKKSAENLEEVDSLCVLQRSANLFYTRHTEICQRRMTAQNKRDYGSINGLKYVCACKFLPCESAGIWKQSITPHVE